MKKARFRDVVFFMFLKQRVMHKTLQIITPHIKRYGYHNDDELIMGDSQREHFQNHLRIFNATTLMQYATLKQKEKRMQNCYMKGLFD